jgi:hypothetical protein
MSPQGGWKTDWTRFFILLAVPVVAPIVVAALRALGFFTPRCPECHAVLTVEVRSRVEPTVDTTGVGVRARTCPACGYHDEREFAIARYAAGLDRSGHWQDPARLDWLRAKIRQPGFDAGPKDKDNDTK